MITNPITSALLTDLYQLTMLQGYFDKGMEETAVFEFYVRKLPSNRHFLVAAGLEQVVDYLEGLRFTADEIEWVRSCGRFTAEFSDYLCEMRFRGDVSAMAEGTVFFADEPILRVVAPLPQAQLVESRVVNLLNFQTMIASKAIRCRLAAPGKLLVDFGMRRAQGAEAALLAARANYVGGFAGTATVLAAPLFGIPVFGTMAHAFVQVHAEELCAFEHFAAAQPDNVVLLIDTYDTEEAARKVVSLAPRLATEGIKVKGVRIDSGNLAEHARRVRAILDEGGYPEITIFASSSLDEYVLQELSQPESPIDGFGIGTHLDTSADHPYLDCVYKLQEYAGIARRKVSEGKSTWPGRKQVYRYENAEGRMQRDVLTLETDTQDGKPLVQPVMRAGERIGEKPTLARIREHCAREITRLPNTLTRLDGPGGYPVDVHASVRDLAAAVDAARTGTR